MNLATAIECKSREKLFVSLALKPGTSGTKAYTKIFDAYGIDAEYVACECVDLAKDMELVRQHCAGASITMPYKQLVSNYIDVNYAAFMPVNTVVNTNGFLSGYNCDLLGLNDLLKYKVAGKSVKILGSGAMSHNAQLVCKEYADFYKVYSRQQDNWVLRNTEYDVLINTTSVGMNGVDNPVEGIRADLVIDCVVGDTPLIKQAREQGKEVITGTEIYLAQLKHQAKLYTGINIENLQELLQ
jgi:shikimate dehydrogenase